MIESLVFWIYVEATYQRVTQNPITFGIVREEFAAVIKMTREIP